MGFAPRAFRPPLTVDYDSDADVLYVSLGRPVPAEGEYVDDIIYRYAMKDNSPSGVTVIDYRGNNWDKKVDELAKLIAKHLAISERNIAQAITENVSS